MQTFLTILEDLKEQTQKSHSRSWKWLYFWRRSKLDKAHDPNAQEEEEALIDGQDGPPQLPKVPKDDPALDRRDARRWRELEPDPKQSLYRKVLKILRVFDRDDGLFMIIPWLIRPG